MLKKLSLALCVSALLAGSASAEMTVVFSGKVVNNTCGFSVNNGQNVDLGTIAKVAHVKGAMKSFDITLTNCGESFNGAVVSVPRVDGFDPTTGEMANGVIVVDDSTTQVGGVAGGGCKHRFL